MQTARIFSGWVVGGALALALAPTSHADDRAPGCAWEIQYRVAESLKITDTVMGQGNGVFSTGPGTVVLRWDDRGGKPGGHVKMVAFSVREVVTVKSKVVAWTTTVTSDTTTMATPDRCSVAAEGTFDGERTVRWSTPVRGVRTDGTLACSGPFCGKLGAPAPGRTAFHIAPAPIRYGAFVFSPDLRTFTMASTHVATTSSPRQSSAVALSGREVRRACVPIPPCR